MEISFSIQGDSEGYVTFECPYCGSEFKLQASEYQDERNPFEDLFCPCCGLTKYKNSFLSKDVMEKVHALAYNYAIEELNKSFKKIEKSINGSKGIIKMSFKPLKAVTVKKLKGKDTTEAEFNCTCCERKVKVLYCAGASKVFCPYCGVDI